jgi:hypothetical protein
MSSGVAKPCSRTIIRNDELDDLVVEIWGPLPDLVTVVAPAVPAGGLLAERTSEAEVGSEHFVDCGVVPLVPEPIVEAVHELLHFHFAFAHPQILPARRVRCSVSHGKRSRLRFRSWQWPWQLVTRPSERWGLGQLISIIHPHNVRSQSVAQKLGMTVEGDLFNPAVQQGLGVWCTPPA